MKKIMGSLAIVAFACLAGAANALPIQTIAIEDGFFGPSSLSIDAGVETGAPLSAGFSAIYGQAFDLYITDGLNTIIQHLFSPAGPAAGAGDELFYSVTGMADAILGQACVTNCVQRTGLIQDITASVIAALPDPQQWCGGGGVCSVTLSSSRVPAPATLALLGLGLAGLGWSRRKRA